VERSRNLQAVDDLLQEVSFNPDDGRIALPTAVLAFLGIQPKIGEPETGIRDLHDVGKKKKKTLARYGGQQIFLQANENAITVMSIERRLARVDALRSELSAIGFSAP
jgi:hypothetical protein